MTNEELRDRFYVETGILDPFERLEEYMSWLEQKVIELSKLHQPTVSGSVCENPHCKDGIVIEMYGETYRCSLCEDKQTDL